MNKGEESEIISESENWNAGQKSFGFKEIVMAQIRVVVKNSSEEMRPGFWIHSESPQMSSQRIKYVGDSRKQLKQSIDVLHDLLQPKFDDEMKEKSKEIYDQFIQWHEKWKNKEISKEQEESYWGQTLKIYRILFQHLCFFLERLGWLETESLED